MTVNRREWLIAAAAGGIVTATSGCATQQAAARPAQRVSRPDTAQSFSDDYQAARARFLAAAEAAGARIENHQLSGCDGPDGRALFMDSAWIGPADADVVVVSVCGTHGAEGFCGSAAQIDWLLNEAPRRALPKGVAKLLVHAVNPFGFAYLLRTNEHGVNINRNSIDFTQPLPANPKFEEIFATFPTRQGHDEDLVAEFDAAQVAAEAKHGRWEVSDALGRGQYTNDQGPEFGGVRSEWSSRTLFEVLRKSCARARHVTYIDWHTLINIGDGQLVYLCFNQTDDPLFERAGRWWTREAIARETVNRQWSTGTSNRRPSRHGILMWGVQHALAPGADVAGAVIEFCADPDRLIFSPQPSMRQWVYARWLRHTKDFTSPTGRFVAAYLREAASPTRRSFQEAALQAARDCYRRAIAGAGEWAKENVAAAPGVLTRYSTFT